MREVVQQRGSALLLALILLLVLSLLAISGMEGSLMQQRMSTAQREGVMALEIAESGAHDAEEWVEDNVVTLADFDGNGGLYDATQGGQGAPDPYDADIWEDDSSQTRAADAVDGTTPRYFIEYVGQGFSSEDLSDGNIGGYGSDPDMQAFRIVVRAEGPSGRSRRIIEVFYKKQI
ncbi:MAG: PilX N-terminal domain-containing pilus assembly protein [Halospina sp.]